jgi:cysteine desulfurase / selenocysteine lyase
MTNDSLRKLFPMLASDLVYLDNAATAQRPFTVINAVNDYYTKFNANVHRGVYQLSQHATDLYEQARTASAKFLNAASEKEIIFTTGTTDSINLVVNGFAEKMLQAGDVIAVTRSEHHSNFVPWQQLAIRKQAKFEIIELNDDFEIDTVSLNRVLALKPKFLAIQHASNVTGVIHPIKSIAKLFADIGCTVVVDAAQSAAHMQLDVQYLGPISFLTLSGHKVFGPTGVGILWGKKDLLEQVQPQRYGGNMIEFVQDQSTSFAELPARLEAGTPNIAGVIGLKAAFETIQAIGWNKIKACEADIQTFMNDELMKIDGVRTFGLNAADRLPVYSVALQGVHAHDLATYFDMHKIAVRAGHHCAHPLMRKFQLPATCRASFAFYNTIDEGKAFLNALQGAKKFFAKKNDVEGARRVVS